MTEGGTSDSSSASVPVNYPERDGKLIFIEYPLDCKHCTRQFKCHQSLLGYCGRSTIILHLLLRKLRLTESFTSNRW